MTRPPRPRHRPLLDRPLLTRIAIAGGFSAAAALALMLTHDGTGGPRRDGSLTRPWSWPRSYGHTPTEA